MAPPRRRRRSPGEGSVWPYTTKAGEQRYAIGYVKPDGTSATRRRGPDGEKFTTYLQASRALGEIQKRIEDGEYADPSRQRLGAYLDEWLDGLRLAPSTVASYRKNVRLHIKPYIGDVALTKLTATRIDVLYRQLEREGRADGSGGLSARTVQYCATILSAALKAAVEAGMLSHNPAAKAHPPTAKQAQAPEMHPWTADQLAAFLAWLRGTGHQHRAAWTLLAMTGMRRGECLALRWRDADLDAGTIQVRRSAGLVQVKGQAAQLAEGPTKTGKPRVVDLGAEAVAALRAHRRERGTMALQLARDDALIFADHEGRHLHPEHFSRTFVAAIRRCQAAGHDVPVIRLHDLRHTHATLMLTGGKPVKVVSERLGHASATITMSVYAHVLPGGQREAAAWFDELIGRADA